MKFLFLSSLLIVSISASFLEKQGAGFEAFKLKHGKTYLNQAEEAKRFNIFMNNVLDIEEHNALYEQGKVSYKQGINKFTDMNQDEVSAMLSPRTLERPILEGTPYVKTGLENPSSIDWREKGQVTEVKDQESCSSCWAFSITGATEAAYYRRTGKLVTLSEQQLVDCTLGISLGCGGGSLPRSYDYIREQGLQSESSYPYEGVDAKCRYSASSIVTKITNSTFIYQPDEDGLLDAVANVGPVAATLVIDYLTKYESGVFEDERCINGTQNHAMLVVGYGTLDGKDYWLLKNSWGAGWGDNGYIKIARGKYECYLGNYFGFPIIS